MNRSHPLNQLIFNTYRIESIKDGERVPSTGYCVNLWNGDRSISRPVIICCRHSLEYFEKVSILLRKKGSDGLPIVGDSERIEFEVNKSKMVFFHPDPKIDLACIYLSPIISLYKQSGIELYYKSIGLDIFPTKDDFDSINVGDQVVMIGYPKGFWDSKNNLPLVKKGCISTPVDVDFEGNKEFIVDIATHPGSSGSPVFYFETHRHKHMQNSDLVEIIPKLKLLGTIYFGQRTGLMIGDGEIDVYDQQIGHVLKSELLLDFIPLLDQIPRIAFQVHPLPG